ncbi:uncharacterized protein DDB_G0283357-like [Leptidea sinapis]|uniref:uncharacterized protein DDB_G0283357-like n=1 Tax=Leptidea sinapis TaxID=189913 RepID=UPI0021C2599B|nr:uncharacterized protein DDB_G0283357-like [Leptidea sinapis]
MFTTWVFAIALGTAVTADLGYEYKAPTTSFGTYQYGGNRYSTGYGSSLNPGYGSYKVFSQVPAVTPATGSSGSYFNNRGTKTVSSYNTFGSGFPTGSSSFGTGNKYAFGTGSNRYNTGYYTGQNTGYNSGAASSATGSNYGSSSGSNYNTFATQGTTGSNYNTGSNSNYNTAGSSAGSNYNVASQGVGSNYNVASTGIGSNYNGFGSGVGTASQSSSGHQLTEYETTFQNTYDTSGLDKIGSYYETISAANHFQSSGQSSGTQQEYYVQQSQQPAQVFKHFYYLAAPEEPEPVKQRQPIVLPPPQKHYKVIFIKAPTQPAPAPQIIPVSPQNEEKTIVYVLVKKPEDVKNVVLPKFETKAPTKPEVFFIKYNDKLDSQSLINNIVSDYNKGGIQASFSDLNLGNDKGSPYIASSSSSSGIDSQNAGAINTVVGASPSSSFTSIGNDGSAGSIIDDSSSTFLTSTSNGGAGPISANPLSTNTGSTVFSSSSVNSFDKDSNVNDGTSSLSQTSSVNEYSSSSNSNSDNTQTVSSSSSSSSDSQSSQQGAIDSIFNNRFGSESNSNVASVSSESDESNASDNAAIGEEKVENGDKTEYTIEKVSDEVATVSTGPAVGSVQFDELNSDKTNTASGFNTVTIASVNKESAASTFDNKPSTSFGFGSKPSVSFGTNYNTLNTGNQINNNAQTLNSATGYNTEFNKVSESGSSGLSTGGSSSGSSFSTSNLSGNSGYSSDSVNKNFVDANKQTVSFGTNYNRYGYPQPLGIGNGYNTYNKYSQYGSSYSGKPTVSFGTNYSKFGSGFNQVYNNGLTSSGSSGSSSGSTFGTGSSSGTTVSTDGNGSSGNSGLAKYGSTSTRYEGSSLSTSQGVPYQTYGPPQFKVL